MALHHKIIHHLHKFHKIRKKKEENLPLWKEKWNSFNETKLGWLERFVDRSIPWLVILLLFVILGEFSQELNLFGWQWMEHVATFMNAQEHTILIIDRIIVGFFLIDIYFNFFKKATFLSFLKTSALDILAVIPLGLFFRVEAGEAQSILHVSEKLGKEAEVAIKEGEAAAKILKLEKIALRTEKAIVHAPKLLRFYRVSDWFGKKRDRKPQ